MQPRHSADAKPHAPDARPLWHASLGVRIIAFLLVALLPIGLVAIYQTNETVRQVHRNSQFSLQALTAQFASRERQVIERAFGAAEAMTVVLRLVRNTPDECRAYLAEYIQRSPQYSFIGLIRPDGQVQCSSVEEVYDFSGYPGFDDLMATPRPWVEANRDAPASGQSVMVVLEPIYSDGDFLGYVSVSLPNQRFDFASDAVEGQRPSELITFNPAGEILTSENGFEDLVGALPADRALDELPAPDAFVFSGKDKNGAPREFTVVPVIPGVVYALAVWSPDLPFLTDFSTLASPSILALLMWLASLLVAYLAVHRLVIQHIRALRRQMRRFADNRHLSTGKISSGVPLELADMEADFHLMAETILRDEATLEDALHEKTVLLREVHHRVRNNLQLISSIMNMQMRRTENPETLSVVRRLQERIQSLASIHRNLYQADDLSQVDAAALLEDIVGQLEIAMRLPGANLAITTDLDPVRLYPDQAVPLSLLASEAVTNAIKYASASDGDGPAIAVELRRLGEAEIRFSVSNEACGDPAPNAPGLGAQLMTAFARQLGGRLDTVNEPGHFSVSVTFSIAEYGAVD